MKLMSRTALLVSLLLWAACRDGSQPTPDGPPTPTEQTIQEVQGSQVPDGGEVTLKGVIVTAIDTFGARTGTFYVQEPEGGPFSGVLVFRAKPSEVALLRIGDVVDISGAEKDEFLPPGDTTGRTVTELVPVSGGAITVTKTGTAPLPTPYELPLLALAAMPAAMRDEEFEKWEGVPVVVRNVAQLSAARLIGNSDPTFQEFNTNGGVRVDTSLAAFPTTLAIDTCFASITGMFDYFYNYKVLPRAAADIMLGGTGCPAPEAGPTACKNGTDDDLDGFPDCADFSCQQDFTSTCQVTATAEQTQRATYPPNAAAPNLVIMTDVIVTAVSTSTDMAKQNLKSIWVTDAYAAAPRNSVQVFVGRGTIPAGVEIGAKVDVVGTVVEFDNTGSTGNKLTEVSNPALRVKTAPDGTPLVPLGGVAVADAKDVGSDATPDMDTGAGGEIYEGLLMTFSGLKVTNINTTTEEITLADTAVPPNTLILDDDIWDYAAADFAMDRCFSSITVVASLNTAANTRMFLPRAASDLTVDVSGAACTPQGVR